VDLCNKHVSCQSKTYSCKAKHYSWLVPWPLWTVSSNRMLSKEEAESITFLEAKKNKENERNAVECTVTDVDTVCTVDEEDVEDNGSFCIEEDATTVAVSCNNAPATAASDAMTDNCLPRGVGHEENDSMDDITEDDIFTPPPQSKRTRLMSDERDSELHTLKLKYKQLFAKSENFCMTAAHWKAHYNQMLQSQVP